MARDRQKAKFRTPVFSFRAVAAGWSIATSAIILAGCSKEAPADNPDPAPPAVTAAAARAPAPATPPVSAPAPDIELQAVALFEQVVAIGSQHRGDCDKIAAEWRALAKKKADLVAAVSAYQATLDFEAGKAFQARYAARLDKGRQAYLALRDACQESEPFHQAVALFEARSSTP